MCRHKYILPIAVAVIAVASAVDLFSIGYKDRFAGMGTAGLIAGMLITVAIFVALSIFYLLFVTLNIRNIAIAAVIASFPALIHFRLDAVEEWNDANLTPIHRFERCFGELAPQEIKSFNFVNVPEFPFVTAFQFQLEGQEVQRLLQSQGYEVLSVEDLSREDAKRVAKCAEITPWEEDRFYHKFLYNDSHVFVLTDEQFTQCIVCEVSPLAPP